jgi:hypothetical protein
MRSRLTSRSLRAGAVGAALVSAATLIAPSAGAVASPIGNFDLILPDRFDFHTWVWAVTPCRNVPLRRRPNALRCSGPLRQQIARWLRNVCNVSA